MNAFYEQMHKHTKIAQASIFLVLALSLLVLACSFRPTPQYGACRVLPKGGRGLGFAPNRGLGMGLGRWLGCGLGPGVRSGMHLHGGSLRAVTHWEQQKAAAADKKAAKKKPKPKSDAEPPAKPAPKPAKPRPKPEAEQAPQPEPKVGSMRCIQKMPLNPKHLLFPWVFHPHSAPLPRRNRGYDPRVDTTGVGHIHLFSKQGVR